MSARTTLPALALLALAAGCSHVSVTSSGTSFGLAARPPGCTIQFHRTKAPERPYDEVATLHWQGNKDAQAAEEELRERACALGADAAVVTRDYVPYSGSVAGFMTATVIKFRAAPAAPSPVGQGSGI